MKLISLIVIIASLAVMYFFTRRLDASQSAQAWEEKYDLWRRKSANNWGTSKSNSGLMVTQQKLRRQCTIAHIMLIAADIFLLTIISFVFLALMAGRRDPFDIGKLTLFTVISQWLLLKAYNGTTRMTKVFSKNAEEREASGQTISKS